VQLIVDIDNDILAQKIIRILDVFKGDGLTIKKQDDKEEVVEYSDEEIAQNWRELVMGIESDPNYYKSEQYYGDRGEYLMEKYR